MAVKIGSARIDERGKITGGAAGDNTGNEVSYQNWYKHSKGWVVIRAKDGTVRKRIADAMRAACTNNNIGYDQSNRSGLYNAVKNLGYNPAKCTVLTETDCSALVRVCSCYALQKNIKDFNTSGEKSVLLATGDFEALTDTKYTNSPDYLMEGDILVTKTKGHTVVVLTDGDKAYFVTEAAEPTLKKGDKGSEVRKLQDNLNKVINASLQVDGSYGQKTYDAVAAFQTKYGLTVDGCYGPMTAAKMIDALNGNAPVITKPVKIATYTLKKGNKGSNVRTLQENLNMVINAGLEVDGSFGPKVEAALKEFQRKYGLVADGIYGKNSYNKMKSLLNA